MVRTTAWGGDAPGVGRSGAPGDAPGVVLGGELLSPPQPCLLQTLSDKSHTMCFSHEIFRTGFAATTARGAIEYVLLQVGKIFSINPTSYHRPTLQ